MKLLKQFILTIFISFALTSIVHSETTPMQITFQATISSTSQGLINGRYPVTIQLLDGSTQLVWYEGFDGVLFVNGTFSIILGADPASEPVLTANMFDIENPRFKVLVKLDSSEEHVIFPLPSAPYAIQAKLAEEVKEVNAERVTGTFISTVNIQNDLVIGDSSFFVDTRTNKVSVGHLTPNYTLDINGSINATEYKINGEDIESILSWKKNTSEDLYYTDGYVGIGTSNPQFPLETIGTINASEYYVNGKPLIKELEEILSWKVGTDQYDIYFNDGTGTGNVGIGVTTPKELLHVNGGIIIGETKQEGTPETGTIQYKSSDFLGYTGSNWKSLTGIQPSGLIEANEVAYWTGTKQLSGSPLFRWDAVNSFLGVGTENPTARLDIHELASDTENIKLLQIKNANDETLLVVDSTNVGVGTSTPEFTLDVNGSINATDFRIGGNPIQTQLLAGTYWSLENYDRIFYDLGNVGIGTSQPSNLLEIASPTGSAAMSFDIGGVDIFTLGIEDTNPEAFVISKGGDLSIPVFTFKGEKIGVGLSDPQSNLHVSGNTGVVIQGSLNSEISLPASGKGTRMMFFPAKAAFRAGTVEGTEWDSINIGTYSIAMGYGGTASGEGSAILGGYKHIVEGDYAVVPGGRENQALGDYSFAAGYRAVAAHKGSFVWADYDPTSNANFTSGSSNQFIIKASNGVGIGTSDTNDAVLTIKKDENDEYLFKAIGNSDAENALVINTSGNVGIGTSDPGSARLAIMNGNFGIGTVTPNAPLTIKNTSPNEYLLYTEGYSVSNTSSVFVVTSSGNVGIGTTTPTERLTVIGKILGTSFQIVDPDNPDATITLQPNPGSPWADPSKADGNTHRTQGLIGIGTPSPNSLLELSNRSGNDPIITFDIDGVDKYSMGVTQDIFSIQPGSGLFQSTPILTIGSENIGIGTYSPSTNLHIIGDSILEGKVAIGTKNVSSIYAMLIDGSLDIEDDLYIQDTKFEPKDSPWQTEGLNIYYISGNVGIGISNPSRELEVNGIISANAIVLSDNLDIGGYLTADNLRLMDTSSNITEASGNLYVEDGELWYQSPLNTLKKLSSPLEKQSGDSGVLAFWTGSESIGESGIAWDNNNKKLDVSGNFNLSNSFSDNGFSVTNSVSMGAPTALNIQSSISHDSILANTQSFTGHQINVDIEKNWGKELETVTVKGLDIKASQSSNSFFLNDASFIGLNVDVSGVTTNTGQVVAAIFKGGRVGINTDNPSVELEIIGTVSANYFNLNDSLSVPELFVGTDKLVALTSTITNTPIVGIGTSTPSTELEVIGTVSANNLTINNGITATTANIGNGTFYINEYGNIGIGTTNPNLYGQLEINKSIEAPLGSDFTAEKVVINIDGAGEDQYFFLRKNITGLDISVESNSASNKLADEKTATGIKVDTSSLNLASNANVIGLDIDVSGSGGTRYAALFNGGFVGIGTRTPNAELHVSGNIIADNLFIEGTLESEQATFNYLVVNESTILNGSVSINTLHVLNNITANSLVLLSELKVSTASLMSLDVETASINQTLKTVDLIVSNTLTSEFGLFTTGLGVGVTSAPDSGLLVSGNVTANSIEIIDNFEMTNATFNVNEGSLFVGSTSSYVGLGTTNPTAPLHLVYTNSSSYSADNNNSWNSIKIQTLQDELGSNSGLLLAPHSSSPSSTVGSGIVAIKSSSSETDYGSHLAFITDPLSGDSTEAMRLTDTGYLGIGTSTPQTNLDVLGNMTISGNLTVSNITLDKISNTSGITITGNGNLIFETTTSFNQNIMVKKGLYFYKGDTPSLKSNYSQLYVNNIDSDLYYMKEDGASVNLTNAFTGVSSKIPFFDDTNSLSDEADLYWIDDSNLLQVGTGNSLTKFEIVTAMNDTTTGNYSSHEINMSVSKRTTAPTALGDNKFTGLNIIFESEDPTSEYQFGRLAENEIGIGLNVDVSNLIAKGFSNTNSTLTGYKYAASFKGGNVGIGTTIPEAALHLVSEEQGGPVFRVDSLDHSGTQQAYSLFVTANGYVGIGTSLPDASLEVIGIDDEIGSAALHVKNDAGNSLLYVQNNGYIGIGTSTPTASLDVAGTISANIGSFGEILGTTLNITDSNGNPSFFVNRDGEVGIGTTNPDSALNLSKTFSAAISAPYIQQKMNIEIAGSEESSVFYFQQDITAYDINFIVNDSTTDYLTGTATGISINMSQLEFGDNSTAIGLNVNVSSNATSKYAALFLGGNVGIGTTTPDDAALEIIGTLNASSLIITDTLTAKNATFNELVVESTASFNGSITINALYADTISANTISMTGEFLANTGSFSNLTAQIATFNSLGIGVDSPAASLDVQGGSIFTGGVTINGSLDVAVISGNSGITINPTGMINIVGITSFNSDVKIEKALYLKPMSTPDTDSNYGILYTDENNSNSLVYKNPSGSTVNISSMYSGTAGVIPYFGDSEFKDDASFTYDATKQIINIGSSDSMTSLEQNMTIDSAYSGDFIGQNLNIEFTENNDTAANTYYGINIELLGQDPDSLNDFGRLAAGETAIGLKVDLTTLKAGQSNADGADVTGRKIAAQFLGGSVGIGTSKPEAALHVRNDDDRQANIPVFQVDMADSSGVYSEALLVSANGYVGIGISLPDASLDIKGKTADDTAYSFIVQNNSEDTILAVRNDNRVGIQTLSPSSNLHIVSDGTTDIPFIINSGDDYSLVVTKNGFVGIGTNEPTANLHIENIDSSTDPFLVGANTDYAFIVKADGTVGIGTSTPQHSLHVNGLIESAANSSTLVDLPSFFDWSSTRGFITRTDNDLVYLGLRNQSEDGSEDFDSVLLWGNNANPVNDLIFENTNSSGVSERLRITATGNIGINEPTPSALLHITKLSTTDHIFKVETLDGEPALIVSSNGYVGIGTDVPSASLHIAGSLEAETILLSQGGIAVSTVNISNYLLVQRDIEASDALEDSSITGQEITLSIGRDTQEDVIGLDINISSDSKGSPYDAGFKYSVYGDAAAYGIKIDMRDLEVRDPAGSQVTTGNNGGKYAAVFMGGYVGIGTTRPDALLEVRQPDAGAIARFSSAYSDMTIHDYKDGTIAFELADAVDQQPNNILTLKTDKVGIGLSNPDKTLVVNGDARIGALRDGSTVEAAGDGNKLYFSGANDVSPSFGNDNGDEIAIYRHNPDSGKSELRVQISSYNTTQEADSNDKFIVGYMNQESYNPILSVQMDGNVGIYDGQSSTVDPATAKLHVTGTTKSDGDELDNHLMIIQNTGGSLADSLAIHHVTDGIEIVPNAKYITFKTNLRTLGTIEGNVAGDGVRFTTYGADYAEYLVKENKKDSFETGDIVGIINGIVSKKTQNAQQVLVKSSNPGVAGNWPGDDKLDEYELIAFFGQIEVKVQGPVEKGQYILPSGKNDGVGIALSKEDIPIDMLHLVVGRAWESAKSDSVSLIKAAVGFNFSVPTYYTEFGKVATLEKNVTYLQAEQTKQFKDLNNQLKDQDRTIDALLKKLNQLK